MKVYVFLSSKPILKVILGQNAEGISVRWVEAEDQKSAFLNVIKQGVKIDAFWMQIKEIQGGFNSTLWPKLLKNSFEVKYISIINIFLKKKFDQEPPREVMVLNLMMLCHQIDP